MTYNEFISKNERSIFRKHHFFDFTRLPHGRWLITVSLKGMARKDVEGDLHTWAEASTIVNTAQAHCIWNNLNDSELD